MSERKVYVLDTAPMTFTFRGVEYTVWQKIGMQFCPEALLREIKAAVGPAQYGIAGIGLYSTIEIWDATHKTEISVEAWNVDFFGYRGVEVKREP